MIRNIFFNFSGQIITFVAALLALPITVHAFGAANYGIIALVIATLGASAVLDLGLSRTTTKFVAERLALDDPGGAVSAIWFSTLLQFSLGVFLGVAGVLLRQFILQAVAVQSMTAAETGILVLLVAVAVPFTLASGSLRGALEGAQRFGLVSVVKSVQNCSLYLLPAISGLTHAGVLNATAWLCASRIVVFLLYLFVCSVHFPSFWRFRLSGVAGNFTFWHYSGWLAVSNLVVAFHVNADKFLLALWAGAAAVGYYAIPMEIVNGLSVIAGSITGVLMPVFSSYNAQKTTNKEVPIVFYRGARWVLLLLLPIVTILSMNSHFLIALWQGSLIATHTDLPLKVALAGLLINALGWVPTALALGLGRADIVVKLQIAQVPLIVLLGWLFIPAYGATGAAMIFLIRVLFETTILYWAASKLLLSGSGISGPAILRLDKIALLALLGLPFYLATSLLTAAWALWTCIAAYALAYVGCWWLLVADQVERKFLSDFFAQRKLTLGP